MLVDPDQRLVWRAGDDEPAELDVTAPIAMSRPVAGGENVYIADEVGMLRVPLDGGAIERVGRRRGPHVRPARRDPSILEGEVYGAWLGQDEGVLWRPGGGEITLDYGGQPLEDARRPVFSGVGLDGDPERDPLGLGLERAGRRADAVQPGLGAG